MANPTLDITGRFSSLNIQMLGFPDPQGRSGGVGQTLGCRSVASNHTHRDKPTMDWLSKPSNCRAPRVRLCTANYAPFCCCCTTIQCTGYIADPPRNEVGRRRSGGRGGCLSWGCSLAAVFVVVPAASPAHTHTAWVGQLLTGRSDLSTRTAEH